MIRPDCKFQVFNEEKLLTAVRKGFLILKEQFQAICFNMDFYILMDASLRSVKQHGKSYCFRIYNYSLIFYSSITAEVSPQFI